VTKPSFASGLEELLREEEILSLTGMQFMRGILEGRLPAPPICKVLSFRLTSVSEGQTVFEGEPNFDCCNPFGSVHGGWYGTLLDSAMACAFMTTLPRGSGYTTLEFKVNVTRPIPIGRKIQATGTVQHSGRLTGVAKGEIICRESGRLYATGSTTCIVLTPNRH